MKENNEKKAGSIPKNGMDPTFFVLRCTDHLKNPKFFSDLDTESAFFPIIKNQNYLDLAQHGDLHLMHQSHSYLLVKARS